MKSLSVRRIPVIVDRSTYAFRCEVRAVESGKHAFVKPGGSIKVLSETQICNGRSGVLVDVSEWCDVETPHQWHNVAYTVKFWGTKTGLVWFNCNCKSGQNRGHLPVPCKHAATAARRLEREGIAKWREGLWYVAPYLQPELPKSEPPNVSALVD